MGRVTVDFSEVEEFEALPDGWEGPALIEQVTYRIPESEEKFPYLNVEFKVTDDEYEGRRLWDIWSLSPKALWRTKQTFEILEIPVDELEIEYDEDTPDNTVTEPDLVGLAVELTVKQEPYEGRIQNRVTSIRLPETTTKKVSGSGKKATAGAKKATGSKKKFQ